MVSIDILQEDLGWTALRSETIIDSLVSNGTAWVDQPGIKKANYWFPAVFKL